MIRTWTTAAIITALAPAAVAQNIPPVGAATWGVGSQGSPVTVSSTATQVAAARTGAPGTGRTLLIIENETATAMRCSDSASVVFAGGTGTAGGTLLPGTVGASINVATTDAAYCITSSGSATVSVSELH